MRDNETRDEASGEKWPYAVATYRYLRLSIVVVVITLGVSVVGQILREHCTQGSISAFYYTPAHSVLVAALGLTGVALIAIRGPGWKREGLLNAAGLLAPVVAFIPTDRPAEPVRCPIDEAIGVIPQSFTSNSLGAFTVGGLIAAGLVLLGARSKGRLPEARSLASRAEISGPAFLIALVLAGLAGWHHWYAKSFETHAHSYSAILMFVMVGLVVAATAWEERRLYAGTTASTDSAAEEEAGRSAAAVIFFRWYLFCLALMVAGVVVWFIANGVGWDYTVLAVEAIETAAFVLFWLVQSYQLWDKGIEVAPSRAPAPDSPGADVAAATGAASLGPAPAR